MKRIMNVLPSREQERDWTLANAVAAELTPATAQLPPAIDLREKWWPIGDQGPTGSCVGWAVADSLLRWHFVKTGRIAEHERLSPRFIWMASKETDEFSERPTGFIEEAGTSLKAALTVARHYGAVLEKELPFDPDVLYGGSEQTFYALASQLRIGAFFNLDSKPVQWRTWLAHRGPVLARLDVDEAWMAGGNGGRLETYDANNTLGGHAVALVGYTSNAFIVRNSWGTGWGDGGYAFASVAYASAAFTESYGITL
jgi:hypothetical protein